MLEPVRSDRDNWSLTSVKVGLCEIVHMKLCNDLKNVSMYQLVDFIDYLLARMSNRDKLQFIEELKFPFEVTLMSYAFGNNLGNIYFLWKNGGNDAKTKESSAVNCVPKFSTRAMRKELFSKYVNVAQPYVLQHMWCDLTGDGSSEEKKDNDDRVAEYFLGCDDPDLIVDLRKNKGEIVNSK